MTGFLNGTADFKPRIEPGRIDINKTFGRLAILDGELAGHLMLEGRLQNLQASWKTLEGKAFDLEAKEAS